MSTPDRQAVCALQVLFSKRGATMWDPPQLLTHSTLSCHRKTPPCITVTPMPLVELRTGTTWSASGPCASAYIRCCVACFDFPSSFASPYDPGKHLKDKMHVPCFHSCANGLFVVLGHLSRELCLRRVCPFGLDDMPTESQSQTFFTQEFALQGIRI